MSRTINIWTVKHSSQETIEHSEEEKERTVLDPFSNHQENENGIFTTL